MLVAPAQFEEVLDIVFLGRKLVVQLVTVPDRTIRLHGTIQLRTPGTIFNIGLGTVPALSIAILVDRIGRNLTGLEAAAVGEGEVLAQALRALLGGDDDDTVRSTGAVQCRSSCTFQDGHADDILIREAAHTADDDIVDDVERLVARVDGAVTADDDIDGSTRVCRRG